MSAFHRRNLRARAAAAWEAAADEVAALHTATEFQRRLSVQNRLRWVLDDSELVIPNVHPRADGTYLATVDDMTFIVHPASGGAADLPGANVRGLVVLESVGDTRYPIGGYPISSLADLGRALAAGGFARKGADHATPE
ncbi:MAG: hypothetical protein M3Q74_06090 [Pseudomonadota bacterium]|nr:hypothetical protein [Pseudomonadota bacterium]